MSTTPPSPTSPEAALIGRRIRAARERHGWTMTDLAERAGVGRPYLSKVEHGLIGKASTHQIGKIAAALGLKLTDLTDGPEPLDSDLAAMITRFAGGDRLVVAEALEELLRLPPEQRREAANWIVTSLQAIRRMRDRA